MKFEVGDRVYYLDGGAEDKGTVATPSDEEIEDARLDLLGFIEPGDVFVRWDNDVENGYYASMQLVKVEQK